MNLRNAFEIVAVLWLSTMLVAGQQALTTQADAPAIAAAGNVTPASTVASPPSVDRAALKIFFTGRLLGYYRLPQWQHADFETVCPDADSDNKVWRESLSLKDDDTAQTPALQFLDFLNQEKKNKDGVVISEPREKGDLLVGMGDNFGVTLESRAYEWQESKDKPWQIFAKTRDLNPHRNAQKDGWPKNTAKEPSPYTIGDNVGCFLSRAGYDAIVPGRDDFYFGPERLRRIAARMAHVPPADNRDEVKPGDMRPVSMLAANLVLKTTYLQKPPEIQDSDKNLKFAPGMPTGIKSVDVSDNGTLPPFARQIRFEISPTSIYSANTMQPFLCKVQETDGLDALDPGPCDPNEKPGSKKSVKKSKPESYALPAPVADKDDATGKVWDFDIPAAWPRPALYGLCVKRNLGDSDPEGKKKGYFCLRFALAEPLLGNAGDPPYFFKTVKHSDGRPDTYVVAFGIVDKDLTTLVGRDNLVWRNSQAEPKPEKKPGGPKPTPPGKDEEEKKKKETYSTVVDTLDPVTTLGFAMRRFALDWKDTKWRKDNHVPADASATPFRVLLAQMDRGKAEALAAHLASTNFSDTSLHFDVVFSSATDFSAASAHENVTLFRPEPVDPDQSSPAATPAEPPAFRHIVVVPWEGYDYTHRRLPNPIRTLTLTDFVCAPQPCREFAIGGSYKDKFSVPEDKEVKDKGKRKDKILEAAYDGMGRSYLAGKGYWRPQAPQPSVSAKAENPPAEADSTAKPKPKTPPPTLENTFQLAVLAALRDHTHADVAMLEKRAFYWGPFPEPLNSSLGSTHPDGELLERILWAGDYLEVLSVKGSTLKKVLDDSDKLDALDDQATLEVVEPGRGLLTLGIEKTRDKQYLVDGMQLDPNRLYTVATSNHIAAGDNGYPELADPQFADHGLPAVDKDKDADDKTPRISSLVCQELGGESCVSNPGLLFASIQRLPSQLEPSMPERVNAYWRSVLGVPELLTDGYSRTNYQAQLAPTWRFSLKDLSLNLSSVRNNLTEVQRTTELAGVTEPGAANAKSHSIDYSSHAEWVRRGQWFDEFVRSLTEYKATITGNTATVPITNATGTTTSDIFPALSVVSRSKNQFALDAGVFWHRGHKYFDKLGMVLEPLHFDTQLQPQYILLQAVYDQSGNITSPSLTIKPERTRKVLQRLAFRMESDKSYFELGYQGGWELNGLQELIDNEGNCLALATQTVTSCLQHQQSEIGFQPGSIRQIRATRERNGLYSNLDWTWPLMWRGKLGFQTQNSFEYYRPAHLDNSTDTLYRNDATETLNFKLWPNLSFGPSLERFDYENKINHFHLRTWGPTLKLTYSFDRLEGGTWKKSLRYSPSTSAAGDGSE